MFINLLLTSWKLDHIFVCYLFAANSENMDSFNRMTALNMKGIGKRKQDGQGTYHTT